MVLKSGNIDEYTRNDLLILYYNTWQIIIIYVFRIYSHPVYIYGFQINLKPRSHSWAGFSDYGLSIAHLYLASSRHFSHNMSNSTSSCVSILGNGISILTQFPKHKPRNYPPYSSDFWELSSAAPSSSPFLFPTDHQSYVLCFINTFKSSPTPIHLHWYCLSSSTCDFLPKLLY